VSTRYVPRARSSSISKSFSLADIERYNAVTEYRFDWRTERPPSCDDMVFWRLTGMKELEEDVEARDGACNIATDIRQMQDDGRRRCAR